MRALALGRDGIADFFTRLPAKDAAASASSSVASRRQRRQDVTRRHDVDDERRAAGERARRERGQLDIAGYPVASSASCTSPTRMPTT
jgi:hypothetical protein